MRLPFVVIALCAVVVGCTPEQPPQTPVAAVPRLSQPGTLFGVLLQSDVGTGIRPSDLPLAEQAFDRAHGTRVGDAVEWTNPETGNQGRIAVLREGFAQNNLFCREYLQEVRAQGRSERVFGTVCRQPGGGWRLASS